MEELRIGSWDPMTMKVCSQEGEPPSTPGGEDLSFFSFPCLHCSTEKGNQCLLKTEIQHIIDEEVNE